LRPGEKKIQGKHRNKQTYSETSLEDGMSLRIAELTCLIMGLLPSFGLDVNAVVVQVLNDFLKEAKKLKKKKVQEKKYVFYLVVGVILLSTLCLVAVPFFAIKACPDGFDHFLPVKGKCYYISNTTFEDRSEAQRQCEQKKGTLAKLSTKKELQNVEANLKHIKLKEARSWIGLIRKPPSPFVQSDDAGFRHYLRGGFQSRQNLMYGNFISCCSLYTGASHDQADYHFLWGFPSFCSQISSFHGE
jgi:hypothetical protein